MRRLVAALTLAFLLVSSASAKERWLLRLAPIDCGAIEARGVEGPGLYFYLAYEITNVSSSTAPLGLNLKVETDIPKLVYWDSVDPLVEKALARRGLRDLANSAAVRKGQIEPGETIRCLAVFGKLSPLVDRMDIVVKGLTSPVSLKGRRRVVENRTLVLHYRRPGDEFFPQYRKITLGKSEWRVRDRREKPYR